MELIKTKKKEKSDVAWMKQFSSQSKPIIITRCHKYIENT
jgi:hypothetical protein